MKRIFLLLLIVLLNLNLFSSDKREIYKEISGNNFSVKELNEKLVKYKDSLLIAENKNDPFNSAYFNLVISKLYFRLGNYNNSVSYGRIALSKFRELKDTTYILLTLFNIGATYGEIQEKKNSI